VKTALVTGASGGIGSAIVKKLIKDGYFVLGQYNNGENAITELKAELQKDGLLDYFFAYQADFSKSGEVQKLYDQISKSFKRIDALIINAGVDVYKLVIDTTEEEYDKLFNINVKSGFMLTKLFLPKMIEYQKGSVVFVSSIWGQKGACMEAVYSATKWAQIGFCKSLALEVATSNVTVNCVCPGVVDTKMNARFSKDEMQEILQDIPTGRLCSPQEVANVISFLTSDSANYITGQTITIDGGFTL
jgi:3-oxoacyl-[acyl-carrier protein] reductase